MRTHYKGRFEFGIEADSPTEAARALTDYLMTSLGKLQVTLIDEVGQAVTVKLPAAKTGVAAAPASVSSSPAAAQAAPAPVPATATTRGWVVAPELSPAPLDGAVSVASRSKTPGATLFRTEVEATEVARALTRAAGPAFVPMRVIVTRE